MTVLHQGSLLIEHTLAVGFSGKSMVFEQERVVNIDVYITLQP